MTERTPAKTRAFCLRAMSRVGLGSLALVLGPLLAGPASGQERWTLDDCATCHDARVVEFKHNPHSILDTKGLAKKAGADFSCAACHGDPTAHINEGGGKGDIVAFKETELASAKTKQCQTCHAQAHPRFSASPHAKGGLDCTSCHSIHATGDGAEVKPTGAAVSENCRQCHGDVFASFALNERHRLEEGILACTSCHDPHEPAPRARLGGFKDEACFQCHTDKAGPFVHQHGGALVEGCTSCHSPHGSPNRHMLAFQSVASLCYSCHVKVPGFHSRFTPETNCVQCHVSIHGSNLSRLFLE